MFGPWSLGTAQNKRLDTVYLLQRHCFLTGEVKSCESGTTSRLFFFVFVFYCKGRFSTVMDMDLQHLKHISIISAYATYDTRLLYSLYIILPSSRCVHIQVDIERDYDFHYSSIFH